MKEFILILYASTLMLNQPNGIINYLKYGINVIDLYKFQKLFRTLYKIEDVKSHLFFILILT